MAGGYFWNPQGAERIAKRIRKIEADLRKVNQRITGLGIVIDKSTGTLRVPSGKSIELEGGDLIANGGDVVSGNFVHGSTGFKLDGTTGTPEFNDLILRGGIIGDDALQHPTAVDYNFADVNSTNFTIAGANMAAASITVPAGFTTAQVLCTINVGDSRQVSAGASPFYAQAWIGKVGAGTTGSAVIGSTCADGLSLALSTAWAAILTGLSGGDVIQGGAWASVDTTSGWTSGGGNAHSVVTATFYR